MIRKAKLEDFNRLHPDSETAVRILCFVNAYGTEQSFLRFWSILDGKKCIGFLSLLDGSANLTIVKEHTITVPVLDELCHFLFMQSDIQTIHTDVKTGYRIFEYGNYSIKTGAIMRPGEVLKRPIITPEVLAPREIYPILTECFGKEMSSFSPWYVDVSHRIRHGYCRIVGIRENSEPVACAMTTAECGGAAIIGSIATLPGKRGKRYASGNVLFLAQELIKEGRSVFLLPKNETAHKLYSAIGFYDCNQWACLSSLNL